MGICVVMFLGTGLLCSGEGKALAGPGEYCQVAETIIASRRDTPETLAQIRRENTKRRKLCGKKSG